MRINLTWDLFVIVFCCVVIAYSFIIGANKTLKIILGSYIAILAADGVGNLIIKSSEQLHPFLGTGVLTNNDTSLIILKIGLLLFGIVLLGTKGNFEVGTPPMSVSSQFLATLIFGLMSGLLLIGTILVFVSGGSFLSEQGIVISNLNVKSLYSSAYVVKMIILNYNLIFVAPALTFIGISFGVGFGGGGGGGEGGE